MSVESKIEDFEKIAIAAATEKKRAAATEMESRFNSMVEEAVREEERKCREQILGERYKVERSKNKQIVDESSRAKRDFISCREKLTAELFESVLEELKNFTGAPEYEKFLTDKIISAAKTGRFEAVQLTRADMRYAEKITAACGLPVEEAKDDFIGGFRLIGIGRRAVSDRTFINGLNEQRADFSLTAAEGNQWKQSE